MSDLDKYTRMLESHPELADSLRLKVTKYMPHRCTPKQRVFLQLPHLEAFYGGAAGGGKSDALLMAALQYVDVPGYSAIIFRKTLADARMPGSILSRAKEWLAPFFNTKEISWDGSSIRFPSGARVQFGYLDSIDDHLRYQSTEFQYAGFDELTHFRESQYLYVAHSRVRHTECPEHKDQRDDNCPTCREYYRLSKVPLRVRSASNPGGRGHLWVKKRFDIKPVPGRTIYGRQLYMGQHPQRPHIPAFIEDNPYLSKSYYRSLKKLDPVTREQLLAGDWGVSVEGRLKPFWARHYRKRHEQYQFGDITSNHVVHQNDCIYFTAIDSANSSKEGLSDAELEKRSWSVIMNWMIEPRMHHLALLKVTRFREESPEFIAALKKNQLEFQPFVNCMEYTTASSHLYQLLSRMGFPMRKMVASTDKVSRNTDFANRMQEGRVFFPYDDSENAIDAQWLQDFYDEIYTWRGGAEETDDQVDCCSYAGIYVSQRACGLATESRLGANHISASNAGFAMPGVF